MKGPPHPHGQGSSSVIASSDIPRSLSAFRLLLSALFVGFQYWILFYPKQPVIERPIHLIFSLALVFLWIPLSHSRIPKLLRHGIDVTLVLAVLLVAWYFWESFPRLQTRIENVSPVFAQDIGFGTLLIALILEAVRRTVGWILVAVISTFILYGLFGYILPGEVGFRGFDYEEFIEIITLTTSGVLGFTIEASVNFIFYFVAFGVVYAAIGGGQLFIDMALRLVGSSRGGGSKVAIVGSSLMGSISGSAVANVTATGVFTIPLMRRTGISSVRAGATEAISSTGGQLMPPIMGVAAFVMAELLVIPYASIALAGLIPALAFYCALFIYADLASRRHGVGTLERDELLDIPAILPRIHLLAPPLVLVAALMLGYSAQRAAMYATAACFVACYLLPSSWIPFKRLLDIIPRVGRQAAEIAVPIAAVGIIVAVAIQSNMALKFSTGVIAASGGVLAASLLLVIVGCIIMGMGLPTVAAYIIGAILYAPALQRLGVPTLASHFFVLYYCVLSMITPPVALASFAAAGLAQASAMRTSIVAFQMSFVAFLIPFAFIADEALLFQGEWNDIAVASTGLIISTSIWAAGLSGYLFRSLGWADRLVLLVCGFSAIVTPTGSTVWIIAILTAIAYATLMYLFLGLSLTRGVQTLLRRTLHGLRGSRPKAQDTE